MSLLSYSREKVIHEEKASRVGMVAGRFLTTQLHSHVLSGCFSAYEERERENVRERERWRERQRERETERVQRE